MIQNELNSVYSVESLIFAFLVQQRTSQIQILLYHFNYVFIGCRDLRSYKRFYEQSLKRPIYLADQANYMSNSFLFVLTILGTKSKKIINMLNKKLIKGIELT